jgi:hypothetical protein
MIFPVSERNTMARMAQMREWKAIPESKRPTWEQFKRGLKVKKR